MVNSSSSAALSPWAFHPLPIRSAPFASLEPSSGSTAMGEQSTGNVREEITLSGHRSERILSTHQRSQQESSSQEIYSHGELLDISSVDESNHTAQGDDDTGQVLGLALTLKVLWKGEMGFEIRI